MEGEGGQCHGLEKKESSGSLQGQSSASLINRYFLSPGVAEWTEPVKSRNSLVGI